MERLEQAVAREAASGAAKGAAAVEPPTANAAAAEQIAAAKADAPEPEVRCNASYVAEPLCRPSLQQASSSTINCANRPNQLQWQTP